MFVKSVFDNLRGVVSRMGSFLGGFYYVTHKVTSDLNWSLKSGFWEISEFQFFWKIFHFNPFFPVTKQGLTAKQNSIFIAMIL